jgi:hypothetical protein
VAPGELRGFLCVLQPFCELGLVSVGPCSGALVGAEPATSTVGTVHAVVDSPVFDEDLGFERGIEALAVDELVTESALERLDPGVLPGLSGVDEDG